MMIFTESVHLATALAVQGDFHSAIEALGGHWLGVGVEPQRGRESDLEYAQVLLACGILTVRLGHFAGGSQAEAKDILSKSARLFGEDAGRYEALFWLASAYSLCGEDREALTLVESVLAEKGADLDVEFSTGVLRGTIHLNLGNTAAASESFRQIQVLLETVSPMSRGRFFLARGILHRQTSYFEAALSDYYDAIAAFDLAHSKRYQAAAQNNIAGVYLELGRHAEARAAARSALLVFQNLRDRPHEAKVWDQLAQVYDREEDYAEMCRCADCAVELLSASDHEGWLAEALITQARAHANLSMAQAAQALSRALAICERQGDRKQAEAVTKTVWEIVRRGREAQDALLEAVSPFERAMIERALERHRGRVSPAAHDLGLHHQALQRRLKTRFPELLSKRKAPGRRRKSLIKSPKAYKGLSNENF